MFYSDEGIKSLCVVPRGIIWIIPPIGVKYIKYELIHMWTPINFHFMPLAKISAHRRQLSTLSYGKQHGDLQASE